jgi:hypothetical protein
MLSINFLLFDVLHIQWLIQFMIINNYDTKLRKWELQSPKLSLCNRSNFFNHWGMM